MRRATWLSLGFAPLLMVAQGCTATVESDDDSFADNGGQTLGAANEGRTVTRWVEETLQTVRAQNVGTPNAGRLYAMVTVAMYDAVNGIDRASNRGRESALVPPNGAPPNGRREAAAAAAAHAVLTAEVPAQAAALNQVLDADLAALGPSTPVTKGRDWGRKVGKQVVSLRSNDGTQAALIMPAGTSPGAHRASFDARFRNMTPFGIATKAPYVSAPPPALTSAEYAAAFNDVKTLGVQDGDAERNQISSFWLAEGGTVRETGTWFQAALAIVEQERTVESISDTARLFALLGMSIADSVVSSWETKATYFTWRPTPAIREADTDGNPDTTPDPAWTSRIGSPGGSPEYNSGTSTFSGAASKVIESFYCKPDLAFCFVTDLATNGPRCYAHPLAAAEEAGRSRIFQGIHFQFSNVAGRVSGRAIGEEVATTRLGPVGAARGGKCVD
jgi:hypothetical protein